jgi:DNA-binding transcriptional LysR family regulator
LRDGSIDFDIGVQGSLGPEIRAVKLLDDELVLLVNRRSRLRAKLTSLKPLADLEHVVVSRRGRERGPLDEQLEGHGLRRVVRAVVPNHLAAAALVAGANEKTAAVVPRLFAQSVSQLLGVRIVALPLALPRFRVALAWHPRFDADPAHAWLREQIRQECAALRDDQKARRRRKGSASGKEARFAVTT